MNVCLLLKSCRSNTFWGQELDTDGSGTLTREEIEAGMKKFSEQNGEINADELKNMVGGPILLHHFPLLNLSWRGCLAPCSRVLPDCDVLL